MGPIQGHKMGPLTALQTQPSSVADYLKMIRLEAQIQSILNGNGVAGGGRLGFDTGKFGGGIAGGGYSIKNGPSDFNAHMLDAFYRPTPDSKIHGRIGKDYVGVDYESSW